MTISDIINDQYVKDIIIDHINNTLNSKESCSVIRFEYPTDSGHEWKIVYNSASDNEIIFKITKRK